MQHDPFHEREKRWLLNEKYQGIECSEYFNDLKHLNQGVPVDYLIGYREFLGCHIDLSYHPLIPRNETEYWVDNVIKEIHSSQNTPLHILDIFAGSGCIGIATLQHLPHCQVDFIEKNPAFVEQIKINLKLNNIDPSRYTVHQSDMFDFAETNPLQWDVIIANPPYIAHDRTNTVQESVHDHEDHNSLYADDNGLYFIKQTIDALPQYLKPGGVCYIEYDPWQTSLITEYLDKHHPVMEYAIIIDQFEKERVIKIKRKKD